MNILNHYGQNPGDKYGEWQGCKPQKFPRGGRKHDNHPLDELDNLLKGTTQLYKPLGPNKRRFQNPMTIGTDEPPRPHIRPNIARNDSKIQFKCNENAIAVVQNQKLMHTHRREDNQSLSSSILMKNNHIGQSKIKQLENGSLQTGIYRNFYKSTNDRYQIKRPY